MISDIKINKKDIKEFKYVEKYDQLVGLDKNFNEYILYQNGIWAKFKPQEQTFNMGSFTVKVRDGKAYHNSEDITTFVRDLVNYYNHNKFVQNFAGYDAIMDEITFKKTGCQNNTTKLSDWKKVYNALNQ